MLRPGFVKLVKSGLGRAMSENFWFVDRDGAQRGPVLEEEIVRLIAQGAVMRETLVWSAALIDWRMASQVDQFARHFGSFAPPNVKLPGGVLGSGHKGALTASFPVWGLFGRSLLAFIGAVLIIPSPWTTTALYKWLCDRTALPGGLRLTFTGRPGDIWYVFMLISASLYVPLVAPYGRLIVLLIACLLQLQILKWFCARLTTEDGRMSLSFVGGYWAFLGWNVLFLISFLTIIGWAWIAKFMMQWLCRNVNGSTRFEFMATGLSILWRSLVVGLLCVLVIPIPWILQWYMQWYVSQLRVIERS